MDADPRAALANLRTRLVAWLVGCAYPTWARLGIDPSNHGFVEALGQDGRALTIPRRARVQPRQIYAFAQAGALGWHGDVAGIVGRGMGYFTRHYGRGDGLFRTLTSAGGARLDERALLYDQAFALLGYAAAAVALDARREFEKRALELRRVIESRWRAPDGAFLSGEAAGDWRESNPHMHLLEACLAWRDIGNDPGWSAWSDMVVEIALSRFIRPGSGALGEIHTAAGRPAPGLAGRLIEPGHQFEWGWLLLRWARARPEARATAMHLIAVGEAGVRNGLAVNALLDDFAIHDPDARLWPQTERLKAALSAAQLTGESPYWSIAHAAARSLLPYLDTPLCGLWFDVRRPNGDFVDSPAPASTFYHLVGAIAALHAASAAMAP